MGTGQSILKRVLDLTISSAALIALSPAFLLIALLVRTSSPGPVFFRQERLGKHGKPFNCYKFRSMYVDCADIRNPDGSTFNAADDPRVTRLGHFLRRTSLDELPQLINVLQGDMSLVGPRPDQVDQAQYYTQEERRKLLVKPGITGLAQINGRNSIPWTKRKALDLDYVNHQSIRLDLSLLLKTIPYIFHRKDIFANTAEGLRLDGPN
jgi:undecaprenyl phosphate N,N'-diacetylbacillosamine 1-phosphate transferase